MKVARAFWLVAWRRTGRAFGSAPYRYDELKDSRAHKVLDSYEVLGGPHVFNVIWTTTKYHDQNPQVMKAFLAALGDVIKSIADDPAGAAAIFVADEHPKMDPREVERIIRLPEKDWIMTPKKAMAFADFMVRVGLLTAKAASWKDIYFPDIHDQPGS